jgi:hypothetical protein
MTTAAAVKRSRFQKDRSWLLGSVRMAAVSQFHCNFSPVQRAEPLKPALLYSEFTRRLKMVTRRKRPCPLSQTWPQLI